MTTRTSKKQMHEAEDMLRDEFPNDLVYAIGERDASGRAYILHNDAYYAYKTNTDAFMAVCELVFEGKEL